MFIFSLLGWLYQTSLECGLLNWRRVTPFLSAQYSSSDIKQTLKDNKLSHRWLSQRRGIACSNFFMLTNNVVLSMSTSMTLKKKAAWLLFIYLFIAYLGYGAGRFLYSSLFYSYIKLDVAFIFLKEKFGKILRTL